MQKHVNLVDLVKSFPTNIFSQNLASIQKRTSPLKFDYFIYLADKSEQGSISNLSTKDPTPVLAETASRRRRGVGRSAKTEKEMKRTRARGGGEPQPSRRAATWALESPSIGILRFAANI